MTIKKTLLTYSLVCMTVIFTMAQTSIAQSTSIVEIEKDTMISRKKPDIARGSQPPRKQERIAINRNKRGLLYADLDAIAAQTPNLFLQRATLVIPESIAIGTFRQAQAIVVHRLTTAFSSTGAGIQARPLRRRGRL